MNRSFALAMSLLLIAGALVLAADWPQWRGPYATEFRRKRGCSRNGPKEGPKLRLAVTRPRSRATRLPPLSAIAFMC